MKGPDETMIRLTVTKDDAAEEVPGWPEMRARTDPWGPLPRPRGPFSDHLRAPD